MIGLARFDNGGRNQIQPKWVYEVSSFVSSNIGKLADHSLRQDVNLRIVHGTIYVKEFTYYLKRVYFSPPLIIYI